MVPWGIYDNLLRNLSSEALSKTHLTLNGRLLTKCIVAVFLNS